MTRPNKAGADASNTIRRITIKASDLRRGIVGLGETFDAEDFFSSSAVRPNSPVALMANHRSEARADDRIFPSQECSPHPRPTMLKKTAEVAPDQHV